MNKKEELIREQRTIEASTKKFLGLNGKFGLIVRNLGTEIVREGGGLHEISYLDNLDEIENNELPFMDEDDIILTIGNLFDGLKRGINIEIKYLNENNELTVSYLGHVVYKETNGELEKYIPHPEWEDKIEKLAEIAMKKEMEKRTELQKEAVINNKIKQVEFLKEMEKKWGLPK